MVLVSKSPEKQNKKKTSSRRACTVKAGAHEVVLLQVASRRVLAHSPPLDRVCDVISKDMCFLEKEVVTGALLGTGALDVLDLGSQGGRRRRC